MRRFELALPRSLDESLEILTRRAGDAKVVAGGTDPLPQLKNGLLNPPCVVDLSGVPTLRTLRGLGLAMTEALVYDEQGRLTNPSLLDYRKLTAADVPNIETTSSRCRHPPAPLAPVGSASRRSSPLLRPSPTRSRTRPGCASPSAR